MRFHIPGRPVPKGRPRMSRTGGVYTPKTTAEYEKAVARSWYLAYGDRALEGRLRLLVNVHTDRHQKQDVDNLAKSVLDGMQRGGAFAEGDQQVYSLTVVKYPATTETLGVWVSISSFDEYSD